jgi:hypothetical protein
MPTSASSQHGGQRSAARSSLMRRPMIGSPVSVGRLERHQGFMRSRQPGDGDLGGLALTGRTRTSGKAVERFERALDGVGHGCPIV